MRKLLIIVLCCIGCQLSAAGAEDTASAEEQEEDFEGAETNFQISNFTMI